MRKPTVKYEVRCGYCLEDFGDDSRKIVVGRKGVKEYKNTHDVGPVTVKKVNSRAKKS